MKNRILLILNIFILFSALAQPFGNMSSGSPNIILANSIINTYHRVNSISGSSLNLVSTAGITSNPRVLIMQMEGANAGRWEWARVSFVSGLNCFLSAPLNGTYNIADKVQLITVPEYGNLTISSTGELTCAPYNPTTGTGGVLAFMVGTTFRIENGGKCDVSGKGFQGSVGGSGGIGV